MHRAVYGGSVSGALAYFGNSTGATQFGCESITVPPATLSPFILILDRGSCSFTEKALMAQRAGAVGVIIADTGGLCGVSPECTPSICSTCPYFVDAPETDCKCFLPYLADDGSGAQVTIPAFMIGREDAERIKGCLLGQGVGCTSGQPLFASMAWDLPDNAGGVEWELWLEPNDAPAVAFRNEIRPYVKYFGTSVQFSPQFFIFDGSQLGCTVPHPSGGFACGTQCTNHGRYCAIDPDNDLESGISGVDIVMESLRQMCIWQVVNATYAQSFGDAWWTYAELFTSNCVMQRNPSAACSYTQQVAAGLDTAAVAACVAGSNMTDPLDTRNRLLEAALERRSDMNIVVLPSAVVNDVVMRGTFQANVVLSALCNAFNARTPPTVCECIREGSSDVDACMHAKTGSSGGLPGWGVGLIVALVMLAVGAGIALVWMYRRQKQTSETLYSLIADDGRLVGEEPHFVQGGVVHAESSLGSDRAVRGGGATAGSLNAGPGGRDGVSNTRDVGDAAL